MTRRRPVTLTSVLCVVAALGGACNASPGVPASTRETLRQVPMPDLSRLPDPVRDQVRERYAVLAQRLDGGATSAEDLGRAYGEVGLILMAAEFETDALSSLVNAQTLVPDDARWPYYLGQLHLVRGEHAEAHESFERALALRPTDLPTLVRLGETYLDHGRPADAQRIFRDALAIEPASAAALGGAGRAALAHGDHAGAAQYLRRALAIEPQATSLHYPLALAYRGLGDLARADAHLRQRGGGEPTLSDPLIEEYNGLLESALAYQNRGMEAMQGREWATAAALFRKGLALEPDNPALGHTLGTALSQMGDINAAIAQFEEVARRSPEFARAHFSLGVLHQSTGRVGDAVRRFEAAVTHDPNYVEAHLALATSLQLTRRVDASLPHYARVVEIDPRRVEAWIAGANVLIRLERYEAAHDWLDRASKVHLDMPEIASLRETVEAILELRQAFR